MVPNDASLFLIYWVCAIVSTSGLAWFLLRIYRLLSGRRWVSDRIDSRKLQRMSLQTAADHWVNSKKSSIIVSLTTIPSRLAHIDLVLKSLLTQSLAPQCIKLYIPTFSKREKTNYQIPPWLMALPGIEIVRVEDVGPATKCIPAIMAHSADQAILVVDDDKLYDVDLVKRFESLSKIHPDTVIASSGWIVPLDLIDKPTTLFRNIFLTPPTPIHATRIHTPRPVDIVMGCSGYLLRPRFFNAADLLNRDNTPDALWYVDDVWISAHCQVPKIVFPAPRLCFEAISLHAIFRQSSLTLVNRRGSHGHRNNTIGIQYFENKWMRKATQ